MSNEPNKLFELVDEVKEEKETTYIVVRKVWVLSVHEEKFEIPINSDAPSSEVCDKLFDCINDEEYRKFKNSTEVKEVIPYIKDYPNDVIKS